MARFAGKKRADERTRTADLSSLQVITHALLGFARTCKTRIDKPISFLCLALGCTVLRSRWCQSGVKSPWIARRWFLFESRSRTPVCGATRCSDRPRYPDGRTVATTPHHKLFIQDAGCRLRKTPLLDTSVKRGKRKGRGPEKAGPQAISLRLSLSADALDPVG